MGSALQPQFQTIPTPEQPSPSPYYYQNQRVSSSSIKQQHRLLKPNTKYLPIGVIQSKINGSTRNYKNAEKGSAFNQSSGSPSKIFWNRIFADRNSQAIDQEQLHATQKAFMGGETVQIQQTNNNNPQQYSNLLATKINNKSTPLDLSFYHSLCLPEYSFHPYPPEPQPLIMCEQQQRNGVKYIGEWKDNNIHGNGILQSNTQKYIGQFRNGLKHYHGRQIQSEQVYEGGFEDGRRKGQGTRWTKNSTEQGTFQNGYLIKGNILYANNNTYSGTLHDNLYNGQGIYTDNTYNNNSTKTVYKGTFKNGVLHGPQCEIMTNNKVLYKGGFKDGYKDGQGTYWWGENQWYMGGYSRGKKNGYGELVKGKLRYKGQFVNGNIVNNQNNSQHLYDEDSQMTTDNDDGVPREWRQKLQRKAEIQPSDKDLNASSSYQMAGMLFSYGSSPPRSGPIQMNSYQVRPQITQSIELKPTVVEEEQDKERDGRSSVSSKSFRPSKKSENVEPVVLPTINGSRMKSQEPVFPLQAQPEQQLFYNQNNRRQTRQVIEQPPFVPPSPPFILTPQPLPSQQQQPQPSYISSSTMNRSRLTPPPPTTSNLLPDGRLFKPQNGDYRGQLDNSVQSTDFNKQIQQQIRPYTQEQIKGSYINMSKIKGDSVIRGSGNANKTSIIQQGYGNQGKQGTFLGTQAQDFGKAGQGRPSRGIL